MTEITELTNKIKTNIAKVIVGKSITIDLLLVAMLCEGHVLIEDVPGVGKTMLARALAISLGGSFKRLQCTPDLLPNDVTGISVFNQAEGDFKFRPGPLFVNIMLADEINRATPRTQSALLEAMQECQVTMDGTTYPLPKPFMVLATQNPVEFEGTFPLPEAQLDRFILKIEMGYPNYEEEMEIIHRLARQHPIESLSAVAAPSELEGLIPRVWDVNVDETVVDYLIRLVDATRHHPDILLGASPRASLALYKTSQALAAIQGRDHVLPDDVKTLAIPVLSHRLMLKPETELRGVTNISMIERILDETPLKLRDKEV
jgi:MoxR-like ATPase